MTSLKVVIASASVPAIDAFIRCVSEIAVLDIPRHVSRGGEEAESSLLFGRLALPEGIVLQLFGIHADDVAYFPWDSLSAGLVGVVVVVDAASGSSMEEAVPVLRFLEEGDSPVVVAAEHLAAGDDATTALRQQLKPAQRVGLVPLIGGDRSSARDALVTLVRQGLAAANASSGPAAASAGEGTVGESR